MPNYTTKLGDTWDSIAFNVYHQRGRELLTTLLIEANAEHINTAIFSAGVTLTIPELTEPIPKTLPPWVTQ